VPTIVTDINVLKIPCKTVELNEGIKIGEQLLEYVKSDKNNWAGLAANQIGINKRVCAVLDMYLVNPIILDKKGTMYYPEHCVSFPKKEVLAKRYMDVIVKADNLDSNLLFSSKSNMFECACVQHEIDHLNGITMFDRVNQKIKRNSPCICGSNKKYKICCGGINNVRNKRH
jgi:peptide deformylase